MFATIALKLPAPHRVLEVPSTAIVSDARGVFAAVVTPENTIHITPVVIERDTGATIEVASGLREGDRVVKIASSQLTEGLSVEVGAAVPMTSSLPMTSSSAKPAAPATSAK